MKKTLLSLTILALAASAQAQIITQDQFITGSGNYTASTDLNGQNPTRTGASGAWTANADYDVSATGLTFSGLSTAGGSVAVSLNPTGGATTWRSATESMSNPGTSTSYLSFLLRSDRRDNIRLGFGANGNRFIGTSTSSFIAGSTTGGTFNINTTYLLVAKLEHNAIGNDERISLWAYADGAPIPISEAAAGAFTVQGQGNIIQTSGAWQPSPGFFYSNDHASATGTASFDELRIGNTWADVTPVPEPTTWALLAGSLTALVVFRRRRQA